MITKKKRKKKKRKKERTTVVSPYSQSFYFILFFYSQFYATLRRKFAVKAELCSEVQDTPDCFALDPCSSWRL